MHKPIVLGVVLLAAALAVPVLGAGFARAPATSPYSLWILTPASGAAVSGLGGVIVVQVFGGFILDQANFNGTNANGHGHLIYSVDSTAFAWTWLTGWEFPALSNGPHTLRVDLVDNSGAPLNPVAVYTQVTVSAGPPSIKILEPVHGSTVSSLGFRLRVAVANFTLSSIDFGGWNMSGEGHIHVFDV